MDSPAPPPPPATSRGGSGGGGLAGDINPSILLIIVILSVIFFVSGLLHLLVRLLLKPSARAADELETTTALQGQLQQLFHLHDSGVDQFFIDTLPVFVYKAIIGVKDPFDCAVCLCEFEPDDKLRLLPKCSHAFHIDCIDTWLLSHSTCPLCRSSLVSDLPPAVCHGGAAALLILESGGESSAEAAGGRDAEEESSASPAEASEASSAAAAVPPLKVVRVKLGKFRNLDGGGGAAGGGGGEGSSAGSGNLDQRRCFSMGSFEYVMDERLRLKVAIEPPAVKPPAANPVRRLAMSECGWSSRREDFKGIEQLGGATLASNPQRAESFSVSKIWRRLRKEKETATTAAAAEARPRTVSFRLPPPHPEVAEEDKTNPGGSSRRSSDCGGGAAPWWDKGGSEFEFDVESGSCDGGGAAVSRAGETPSFAWRTMLWLVGRNHKVVNHV